MQWQQMNFLDENPTLDDLVEQSVITENYVQSTRLAGLKLAQRTWRPQLTESPLLEQLLCSVERLTAARIALQSWMETNESENGRTLLTNVKKHSAGYSRCLHLIEESLIAQYLAMAVAAAYLSD